MRLCCRRVRHRRLGARRHERRLAVRVAHGRVQAARAAERARRHRPQDPVVALAVGTAPAERRLLPGRTVKHGREARLEVGPAAAQPGRRAVLASAPGRRRAQALVLEAVLEVALPLAELDARLVGVVLLVGLVPEVVDVLGPAVAVAALELERPARLVAAARVVADAVLRACCAAAAAGHAAVGALRPPRVDALVQPLGPPGAVDLGLRGLRARRDSRWRALAHDDAALLEADERGVDRARADLLAEGEERVDGGAWAGAGCAMAC